MFSGIHVSCCLVRTTWLVPPAQACACVQHVPPEAGRFLCNNSSERKLISNTRLLADNTEKADVELESVLPLGFDLVWIKERALGMFIGVCSYMFTPQELAARRVFLLLSKAFKSVS